MTLLAFFIAFSAFFLTLLNLLPEGDLPIQISESFTLIVGHMKAWNSVFPVTELLQVVAAVVFFEIVLLGWKITKWLIHIIRGSGTSS